jgi:hypothetical protein
VAGCCECGDESSGSCATELVSWLVGVRISKGLTADGVPCQIYYILLTIPNLIC